MIKLSDEFTPQDLDTLVDALDDWEIKGSEILDFIDYLKKVPDPPESIGSEYKEKFEEFKKHMLSQEIRLKKDRKIRRERAILLKAKIILTQQKSAADKLFDDAS